MKQIAPLLNVLLKSDFFKLMIIVAKRSNFKNKVRGKLTNKKVVSFFNRPI